MNDTETNGNDAGRGVESEIISRRWSVVSFDKCEASGLTYTEAIQRMADLEQKNIPGLCIVTDEAAARIGV